MRRQKDELELYFKEREKRDPEFKKALKESKIEFEIASSMIDARLKANLTQKDLAKITGIDQANISKIENGEGNPTIKKLMKLAKGMNAELSIKFIPLSNN